MILGKLIATVSGKEDEFLGNGRSDRDILQMYTDAIEVRPAPHYYVPPQPLCLRPRC